MRPTRDASPSSKKAAPASKRSGSGAALGRDGAPKRALEVGRRAFLRPLVARDEDEFLALTRTSKKLHGSWVRPPRSGAEFAEYLRRSRRRDAACYVVCRLDDGSIAGVFNLSQIARGNLQSAYLGYYAAQSASGQGFMTEGLELVLRVVFTRLGLHRIEANIQPENGASIRLVRRCGFRREGRSPRYLHVAGAWRDHERYAVTFEDWRARCESGGAHGKRPRRASRA